MTRMTAVLLALTASPAAAAAQRLPAHNRLWSVAYGSRAESLTRGTFAVTPPPMMRLGTALPARLSWRGSDVALAGAFVVALATDAAQTRGLARRQWRGYRESNPILGAHPSVGRVNTYSVVTGLTVLGAAAAVSSRVRPWLLGAALAVETFTVGASVRQGVAVKFP